MINVTSRYAKKITLYFCSYFVDVCLRNTLYLFFVAFLARSY